MKERPILYSTDMVKALLDGRKTQTRRPIKPQPVIHDTPPCNPHYNVTWSNFVWGYNAIQPPQSFIDVCPFGQVGDLLYVRETWKPKSWSQDGSDWKITYKAGSDDMVAAHLYGEGYDKKEEDFWIKISDELDDAGCPMDEHDLMYEEPAKYLNWKPSIHMPKTAARIWLKITDVRVERVQDISGKDAVSEGIKSTTDYSVMYFASLWDSIYKDHGLGWEVNPWVWVVEFEVVSTNGRSSL